MTQDEGFLGDLFAKARKGDTDALSQLVVECRPDVYALLRRQTRGRTIGLDELDDLAQECFRRFVTRIHEFEFRGCRSLVRWLTQVVSHVCADRREYYRAKRRGPGAVSVPVDEAEQVSSSPGPHAIVSCREVRERVMRCIQSRSPEDQRIAMLVIVERVPLAEAARRLNLSINIVRDRSYRLKAVLSLLIARDDRQ